MSQGNELKAKLLALDALALFYGSRALLKKAPIEILHKYLIKNEEYSKLTSLINEALPKDIFDDDHWLSELSEKLDKKGNKEDAANIKALIRRFEKLREFLYENKIFQQALTEHPNPDVDALVLSEILIEEFNNVKKQSS